MDVAQIIDNMKIGDVVVVHCEDECVDYLTKTKWFDSTIFVFGGLCYDPTVINTYFEGKDISTRDIIETIEDITDMKLSFDETTGKMNVVYSSEEVLRNNTDENFDYKIR